MTRTRSSRSAANRSDDSDNVSQVLTNVAKSTRARREARRDKIQSDYTTRMTNIRNNITTIHASRTEAARQDRKTQLSRLIQLLRAKASLEERLDARTKALREAYLLCSEAVREVLRERARDLV